MRSLYPKIKPHHSYVHAVDGHQIYFEESGDIKGIPVVFLHGGPGSGSSENHRRYFDPAKYRIINFDQRGCNRSIPNGLTENNTSQHLIADIESIREQLNIDNWVIFGGSWGATLGLLYAQAFPEKVCGMILRGSFLARKRDLDWFIYDGASRIFPDYWQNFIEIIPQEEREDLVNAYHKRVHGKNEKEKKEAAIAWSTWAGRIVTYLISGINPDNYKPENIERTVSEVLIETHYAKHRYFIAENQILDHIAKLPEVPIHIIHGRRDLTCTLESSWVLDQAIPGSKLVIVKEGGHLAGETAMIDALVSATDLVAEQLI
jgi:proline iminopeptidase